MQEAESSAVPFRSNSSTWDKTEHHIWEPSWGKGGCYQSKAFQQSRGNLHARACVCPTVRGLVTSFQTGFSSLSTTFVFFFSSESEISLFYKYNSECLTIIIIMTTLITQESLQRQTQEFTYDHFSLCRVGPVTKFQLESCQNQEAARTTSREWGGDGVRQSCGWWWWLW